MRGIDFDSLLHPSTMGNPAPHSNLAFPLAERGKKLCEPSDLSKPSDLLTGAYFRHRAFLIFLHFQTTKTPTLYSV